MQLYHFVLSCIQNNTFQHSKFGTHNIRNSCILILSCPTTKCTRTHTSPRVRHTIVNSLTHLHQQPPHVAPRARSPCDTTNTKDRQLNFHFPFSFQFSFILLRIKINQVNNLVGLAPVITLNIYLSLWVIQWMCLGHFIRSYRIQIKRTFVIVKVNQRFCLITFIKKIAKNGKVEYKKWISDRLCGVRFFG